MPYFYLAAALLTTTTLAASTCKTTTGVIVGTGHVKSLTGMHSSNECCAECFSYGYNCKAFTFVPSTGDCYLKDNTATTTPAADRVSGTPASTPGPSPDSTKKTRACLPGVTDHFPFCNTSLTIEERVESLINLLKLEEIPPLMTAREGGGGSPGPPGNVTRLGLPEYDWGVNCIHGMLFLFIEFLMVAVVLQLPPPDLTDFFFHHLFFANQSFTS